MTTINGEYTPSPTPKPHPRVTAEAASYADRNRGNMEKWFDYSGTDSYQSPRPAGRTVTEEGRRNAEQNKGSMSNIMGGYADPPLQRTVHPRAVKGDGSEIANQSKGGAMKELMDNYGHLSLDEKPVHKVHGHDAEEYAERNHGTMDKLMNNYGQLSPEQPPPQKVSYGGEEVAEKYRGAGMGPLLRMEGQKTPQEPKIGKLHQTSEGPGWDEDPPAVRTRPEAEAIADKQQSEFVGNLMRGEVNPPTVREPKLGPQMQESVTPRPQTSPLRTRPEARQNYNKNQSSEMSAIMHGDTVNATPTRKSNRMMMKSEDW
ncbi:uncharacterized protein LOC123554783 [Mercenaria mercenaria]|uniref:uncharacterized protein LOC123554783 n=1 Tax=Mercenaria mercenaria TaxID=6596 RepID=UPI00234E50C7|nr:uncharacterized protein LOC123554783 [Mercenaria mercenaria]XP_053403710.1 uncharacterized protein LOC123554783 [Mercenaria mercenaria]